VVGASALAAEWERRRCLSSVIKNKGYLLSVIRYLFNSLSQKFDKKNSAHYSITL